MQPINMQNTTTSTVLEVIPAEKLTAIWNKPGHAVRYETYVHEFPIFIDGVMFTKYVPRFEGMYATNVNGDLASLGRTIISSHPTSGLQARVKKSKVCKARKGAYNLSNEGTALQLTRKGLIFYSGFKKPTFDATTVFPVEYKGKKWIAWLPGNLHLKAAIATDGSVLTMECMTIKEGDVRNHFYSYLDERLVDPRLSPVYRNKEKTVPIPCTELIAYAKLKCKALGITP